MPKAIHDEFSALPVSRQRKYQLRMRRDGRCSICGDKEASGGYCLKHMLAQREGHRRRNGSHYRINSKSYRLQKRSRSAIEPRAR
jgi:hypothetical protein